MTQRTVDVPFNEWRDIPYDIRTSLGTYLQRNNVAVTWLNPAPEDQALAELTALLSDESADLDPQTARRLAERALLNVVPILVADTYNDVVNHWNEWRAGPR